MPGLMLWKNQEINRMRRDMERLLCRLGDDFGVPFIHGGIREVPSIDLSETGDTLIIKAEVPGIDPEDLEISVNDDVLTIRGEIRQESVSDEERFHRIERRKGSFTRTLRLPCRVRIEDVNAIYQNGVLNVVMPKCLPEKAKGVKIQVI